jgi:hypothetical protein
VTLGVSQPIVDLTKDDPSVALVPLQVSPKLEVRVSIDYTIL